MRAMILAAALAAAALPAAAARAAELPPGLEEKEKEGEKWFHEAGNTDLSTGDRNDARRKAWTNLYPVLEALNRHWEENPGDQGKIEERIMKVGQMVFWLRKESPVGLLESTGVGPKAAAGTQTSGWGPKPPGEEPGGAPGAGTGAPGGPGPGAASAPSVTLEKAYAEAEAYAKKHRADLPGIMQRFHEVLARFPDQTGNPLFLEAARRAGDASARLKDVYRRLRDDDPDSLKNVDSTEVTRMLLVLGRELSSQDSAVRERAAKLLALLGSGEAVFPLVSAARKEAEPQALQAELDAVTAIGGRKAVDRLGDLRDEAKLGGMALEALQKMTGRNPVDRRLAIREMGTFALARDDALAARAVDFLVGLGPEGAHGLVEALGTNNAGIRLKVIPALGATKNPRVARPLSNFLLGGDNPNTEACRKAAMEAIKSLGEPAVPYLFPALRSPRTKLWAGYLLREMTGQMFGSGRPGDWVTWWKGKHPDWKEEAE